MKFLNYKDKTKALDAAQVKGEIKGPRPAKAVLPGPACWNYTNEETVRFGTEKLRIRHSVIHPGETVWYFHTLLCLKYCSLALE